MGVFIIAEAGVNHNGQLDLAIRLCDAAKKTGVDAIKFQTWKTENIVTKSAELATYQEHNIIEKTDSQFEMLKKLELGYDEFLIIKKHCESIGIQFLSTPDDEESLDFLVPLGLSFLKIGSGEITNIPYLKKIGQQGQDVVLSTGMSTLSDVERAYNTLKESGAKNIILLHCTTNYPCPIDEVNLRAMCTLKEAFKCEVGYSDHTMGTEVPIAAVVMGAKIIEKHFTLDRDMEGPDHQSSLNPKELEEMVRSIRNIERALGDGVKKPNASEQENAKIVLKRIVARQKIEKGEILSEKNLTVKRSSSGLSALYWDLVNGRVATKNFDIDEPILI